MLALKTVVIVLIAIMIIIILDSTLHVLTAPIPLCLQVLQLQSLRVYLTWGQLFPLLLVLLLVRYFVVDWTSHLLRIHVLVIVNWASHFWQILKLRENTILSLSLL